VIASHTLTAISDIFDRLIVADTRRLGVPLLSRDTTIRDSGLVTTIWD
jgi:PIN domain nuclease of toxin-antitoxin system